MADYNNQYLTLVAKGSGEFKFEITTANTEYYYSTDEGSSWVSGNSATTIAVNNGDRVMFKGELVDTNARGIGIFSATTNFEAEGNAMSLLYGDNFIGQTSLSGKDSVFYRLFYNCITLTSIENLKLPATTLSNYCYYDMFRGCTSLTSIPSNLLTATTLADYCYMDMFFQCTSLTSIPSGLLPATTLASGCYVYMFYGCASLTSIPSGLLPATTLADYCYMDMFYYCTSLTSIPSGLLPATTLTTSCYQSMFDGCTSLTTLPRDLLPATTLANNCYQYMFYGCTSLTTAPQLSATTLASGCYQLMFSNCTSLTTAPVLSATTLATYCYQYMFLGCTSLTTAPVLSATTLAQSCYRSMFYNCTSLSAITCLATDITAAYCTFNWVNGVADSGTFYKSPSMNDWTRSTSGIPVTWNVVDYYEPIYKWERITPVQGDPSTFICDECEVQYRWTATTGYECSGTTKMTQEKKQVSYDSGETWTDVSPLETRAALPVIEYDSEDCGYIPDYNSQYLTLVAKGDGIISYESYYGRFNFCKFASDGHILKCCKNVDMGMDESVSNGEKITLWGTIAPRFKYGVGRFSSTTNFEAEGNIMSLLYGENFSGQTSLSNYAFYTLFNQCTRLTSAENLILPATTLATSCYTYMFSGCTNLTTAPTLPATTLADYCYAHMFDSCTSLTTAPNLPATTLAEGCYNHMFQGCTNLTTAPSVLPATTLESSCYYGMFDGCTSLTTAPQLPATTLANQCYLQMFFGCTSLTTAPSVLPATTLTYWCYQGMFQGCTSLTTAPQLSATTLATYCYQSMFRDCTSLATAPELLATTLVDRCYMYMFNGCTSLNEITCYATDISATDCTDGWVYDVANSGTFKTPSTTNWASKVDFNGIPNGWTRVDI